MVKKATSGMLVMLLLFGLFGFNWPTAKAQTASPSAAVITVSGVPTGTQGLAVEVTVDTSVVTLGSGSSSVSGGLVITGSMSEGVGIISTSGNLPASFTITVPLVGVAAGMSAVTVGMVLDMIGGTAITGASAMVDVSSVAVASSSTSTSSSTSSTGGAGGMLSADTFTATITGDSVTQTNALNLTVAFGDSSVVALDSGVTFMGMGATLLLSDVDLTKGVLTVVWDGTISDKQVVVTGMLKPGSMGGTSTIGVGKVEAAGGLNITSNVAVVVDPTSVTNSAGTTTSGGAGTFALVGPTSVVGPGKAAIAFKASGATSMTATLNGAKVDFVANDVGIAIVDVPASGSLALSLSIGSQMVDLGKVTVTAGQGSKLPVVKSARAQNGSSSTILRVLGSRFSKDTTSLEIVPTDRASSAVKVTGKVIKATYPSKECIPTGSYINVTTAQGTAAKKIKVRGSCSNKLVK